MLTRYAPMIGACLVSFAAHASAQTLRIFHIDVDQGAATLFVAPSGATLLVDSGKDGHGARLRAALATAGVSRIDHFVATHYHEDHYGGVDEIRSAPAISIVKAYDRGDKAFLPASRVNSATYKSYQAAVGQFAQALTRGRTIPLDPLMTVTVISAGGVVLGESSPPNHGKDENDMSVSLLITFGRFRYFVGGDIETPTEAKIAARDLVLDVDIYAVNHHGADNGSSSAFLTDLTPTVAIISNGSRADYRHPRRATLLRLAALNPPATVFQTNKYLLTDVDGGNVADAMIADLTTTATDGTILATVDATTGTFQVTYRSEAHDFTTKSRPGGSVVIESLVPDPLSSDIEHEEVVLRNSGSAAVSLDQWQLRDKSGRVWALAGLPPLGGGERRTVRRAHMPMSLDNVGDTIVLLDGTGTERDRVQYGASQPGVRISTGH